MRTISYSPPTARRPKPSRAKRTLCPTLNLGFGIRLLLRFRWLLHAPELISLVGDRMLNAATVDLVGKVFVLLNAAGPVPRRIFRRELLPVLIACERKEPRENVGGKSIDDHGGTFAT